MSGRFKLIAIVAAVVLLGLVLYLSGKVENQLSRPEQNQTFATETGYPESTDYTAGELPMLPFN